MNKLQSLLNDPTRTMKIYFNLLKISYVVTALMVLAILSEGFHWFLVGAVLSGVVMTGLQFAGVIAAEKLIAQKSFVGLLLAFFLNTLILPTMFAPVSILGFYVLLRQKTQALFPAENNPQWLNDFFNWMNNVLKPASKAS